MNEFKTKTGQSGGIVVPGEYRRRLGPLSGDEIIMTWTTRARALVRRYVPGGRSLSDELISERREEAARE